MTPRGALPLLALSLASSMASAGILARRARVAVAAKGCGGGEERPHAVNRRREVSMGLVSVGGGLFAAAAGAASAGEDPSEVTARAFLDVALCPLNQNQARTLSENTVLCKEPVTVGRLVIGLYGNAAPDSTRNFLELARRQVGGYKGTVFQEVHRGDYVLAGRQGNINRGGVDPGWTSRNTDITNTKSFVLRHDKPGLVSMGISSGLASGGIGSAFTITTGPSSTELDDTSIVIGEVLDGWDTLERINSIPTFRPTGAFMQLTKTTNEIGGMLGDQRAERARSSWVKPKLTILITDAGILT